MNKRYVKGRAFEYQVKRLFQRKGFMVFRMAGSRPCDLIALKASSQPLLIECKSSREPSPEQIAKLQDYATKSGAQLILAIKHKHKIVFKEA